MTSVIPSFVDETRLADAQYLPRKLWKAKPSIKDRYLSAHKATGAVYDTAAVTFLRRKGLAIPKPRSEYHWKGLFNDQFFNYWNDEQPEWNEAAFSFALRDLKASYSKLSGLTMAEYDEVQNDIQLSDKASKSSGAPLFLRKSDALAEDLGRAKAIATGRVAPPPNVAYHRTQEEKIRLVWGYPLSVLMLEGRFMLAIERGLRFGEFPYLYGYTSSGINGRLSSLAYSSVQYCLDWSKFDSSMPHRIIHAVFSVIRSWFAEVDETAWDVVTRYFCTCPVIMPDGYIYHRRTRGIPSGSWFTQLVGSMTNQFLTKYISYLTGDRIRECVYLGDDSVLGMDRMPNIALWAAESRKIGMTIHPRKQVLTHGIPHFLQHYWGDLMPHRPLEDTISRLATHERFIRFKSQKEYFQYTIDKARSLLVDNPAALDFLSEYIAFRFRTSPSGIRMRMAGGDLQTGTSLRRGWAEGDHSLAVGYSRSGFKRVLSQQMLCH